MAAMKFWISCVLFTTTWLPEVYCSSQESADDLVEGLANKFDILERKIQKLQNSEKDLKASISALISSNVQFRLQIGDLTEKLEKYVVSEAENRGRIEELKHEMDQFRLTGNEQCQTYRKIQDDCSRDDESGSSGMKSTDQSSGSSLERGSRQSSVRVAFTAYLDHAIKTLTKDQTIVYNVILLNDGDGYDKTTGVFTAPASGVYLFSWSATARKLSGEQAYDIWSKLVVDGVHQVGVVAESRDDSDDNQGSNTVVLRLREGQRVWTAHYSSSPNIHGDDNERTTSFMGVLLYLEVLK